MLSTIMSTQIDRYTSNLPYFSCILAREYKTFGIGNKGKLSWNIPEDIKEFKRITTYNSSGIENIVIMGRITKESIVTPLVGRINIVVSPSFLKEANTLNENFHIVSSFENALKLSMTFGINRNIFVIGGKKLYQEAFQHPKLETIYETTIRFLNTPTFDTFFEECIPHNFSAKSWRGFYNGDYHLTFDVWSKNVESGEKVFIDLLEKVLNEGEDREDRTNTGTLSIFGPQIEFDNLDTQFPLLTSKRVSLKTVFEELIWMLRGQTHNKILNEKGVKIWNGNSTREFLDSNGLNHYPEGELGPIYGAQWRNFGGKHDSNVLKHVADNDNGGVDQISELLHQIRTNPTSRRLFVSAFNPKALKEQALPPCHVSFQMYIRKQKYLDCKLIMRSNDLFLGAPFNIACYSLLTHMIAAMTGYTPGRLILSIGDAHIYKNHIDQVKTQISRNLRHFPVLKIKSVPENIEDFEYSNFELLDYNPHPTIRGDMAV